MNADRIRLLEEELAKAKIREDELLHRCDLLELELSRARGGIDAAIEELRK